jgi:hypothetical protein
VLGALHDTLCARIVEDGDHLNIHLHDYEGQEVDDLELVSNENILPPFIYGD